MRADDIRDFKASSWPRTVVRKWLNVKERADDFHSDRTNRVMPARRRSCSNDDSDPRRHCTMSEDISGGLVVHSSENLKPTGFSVDLSSTPSTASESEKLSVFVGTWNVGGRSPHGGLDLKDWLVSPPTPADIYVLGFQEIVPLNAGNVLGSEDRGPAQKWLALIRRALNPSDLTQGQKSGLVHPAPIQKPRVSFSDLLAMVDEGDNDELPEPLGLPTSGGEGYRLAASKQMVGIFLCVWVRAGLMERVDNVKVSCVGRGIMGFMGNKGSVSISMRMEQTTFCFVCTHLTSGEKDGDELRRNSDIKEILKRTRFSHFRRLSSGMDFLPESILDHDKIICLGDLNYRLATNSEDTEELLQQGNWRELLDKDQLRIEQGAGRVFEGWGEGLIHFPPTYKYIAGSDRYAVDPSKPREKRRTPAWCDRILWRGEGMKQMWYKRGVSRYSDHRPVHSLFSIELRDCMTDRIDCRRCTTTINSDINNSSLDQCRRRNCS